MHILKKTYLILIFFRLSFRMTWDRLLGKKIIIISLPTPTLFQYLQPTLDTAISENEPWAVYAAIDPNHNYDILGSYIERARQFPRQIAKRLFLADLFIDPSLRMGGPLSAPRVFVSHNQPIKNAVYPKDNFLHYTHHFMLGPLQHKQYDHIQQSYGLDATCVKRINIGFPKSDKLLKREYERNSVLAENHLDTKKFTVIYSPSWEEGTSLRTYGFNLIDKILSIPDINLIVKLHPVSLTPPGASDYQQYTGGVNWVEEFTRYANHHRVAFINNYIADPFLAAADLMVTDVSSIALEFIHLDRPIIYIDCPAYIDCICQLLPWLRGTSPDRLRNDPLSNGGRHVGTVVNSLDELHEAIQSERLHPERLSECRKSFSNELLFNHGQSAVVSHKAIRNILTNS